MHPPHYMHLVTCEKDFLVPLFFHGARFGLCHVWRPQDLHDILHALIDDFLRRVVVAAHNQLDELSLARRISRGAAPETRNSTLGMFGRSAACF